MLHIGLYRGKHKKILSEITRPRALIFGMYYHLVDLYQACSNYAPGGKIWPHRGSHILHMYKCLYVYHFFRETDFSSFPYYS